jgi:hypothetical protein
MRRSNWPNRRAGNKAFQDRHHTDAVEVGPIEWLYPGRRLDVVEERAGFSVVDL